MSKLYYTDPLAAAYMAREFGVKFNEAIAIEKTTNYRGELIEFLNLEPQRIPSWTTLCVMSAHGKGGSHGINTFVEYEIPVHPDSLDTFEPKMGDLIFDEVQARCNYEQHYILEENTRDGFGEPIVNSLGSMGGVKIIRRDNKPFFWPEQE